MYMRVARELTKLGRSNAQRVAHLPLRNVADLLGDERFDKLNELEETLRVCIPGALEGAADLRTTKKKGLYLLTHGSWDEYLAEKMELTRRGVEALIRWLEDFDTDEARDAIARADEGRPSSLAGVDNA